MEKFAVEDNTLWAGGDLEIGDLAAFDAAVDGLIEATGGEIVLDFTGVDYMPSSFLGELMSVRGRLARDGRRFVLKPSEVVRHLLQMTGMLASITIAD